MSYAAHHHFSLIGFAAAAAIAISLNGAVLLGFDHLATATPVGGADPSLNMANAVPTTKQVTLERVVISARRV